LKVIESDEIYYKTVEVIPDAASKNLNMGDLMASKDKNIHEIKRDIAKKKQIKADHHKEQILQFFAYRGDIMI
jgi:hypothetical protein